MYIHPHAHTHTHTHTSLTVHVNSDSRHRSPFLRCSVNVEAKTPSRHRLLLSSTDQTPWPTVNIAPRSHSLFEGGADAPHPALSPAPLPGGGEGADCLCRGNQTDGRQRLGITTGEQWFTLCVWGCLWRHLSGFSTLKTNGTSAFEIKGEVSCLQLSFCSPLGNPVICILDVNSCKSALIFR